MSGQSRASQEIRGKLLHPDIARRVVSQFTAGNYEEAVFNAFKVVDERLRQITGAGAEDPMEVIKLAFNPNTGTIKDDRALPGEREGLHLFVRGAFLAYRNPMGHRFVNPTEEEAFDLLVLVNRIYLTTEDAYQRKQLGGASAQTPTILYNRADYDQAVIYQFDADNDGENEIVIPSYDKGKIIAVFDSTPTGPQPAQVDEAAIIGSEGVESVTLVDIDNDGLNELVCVLGWASSSGIVILKYRNGQYEVLRRGSTEPNGELQAIFMDAQVSDVDNDGQLEIVSEPWWSIPARLIPSDYVPEEVFGITGSPPWGRVKTVWRWNRTLDRFECLEETLLYIGGR